MIKHLKGLLIVVGLGISSLAPFDSCAQTLAKHNWYFGNTQRSIRFNRVTNQPSLINNKATPFGTGGSAVATDRGNGNLLFYTDGKRVYDAKHSPMPSQGAGLTGNDASNQPAVITKVPGQPGKYFIFTNTANFTTPGTISFTVVDMNLYGSAAFPSPAFGDVEALNLNVVIPTLNNVSEGMITLPHANGRDFWLVTQNVNTRVFNATLINAASYTARTFNTVASTAAALPTIAAQFAYHEGTKKLAVAPQDASTDAIILLFHEDTGIIDFDRTILNSGVLTTTNQAIYDIEWSSSAQYLYLSRHGEPTVSADVLQYDYTNSSITLKSVLPSPVFRSYGLQRAPDDRIYHLYQASAAGPFLLGRIEAPDSVASKARYNVSPAGFAGLNFDGKQFPGFAPKDTITLKLDFTFAGTCQNSPTTFFPFVRPGADSLLWTIDDTVRNAWSPIHTFGTAGSFNVKLRAFYQGKVDSVSKAVPIQAFALTLQMTSDTTACKEEFPPPRGSSSPKQFSVKLNVQGGTPQSIVWSNGDVGPTLTPDSAGYYYAVVTDAGGCSAYKGVNVKEYGLQSQIFNKWYFGKNAGIDFTKQPAKPLNESAMDAPEGCAIACDRNGQQIFYTDGFTVWDKTHAVIATDIGGNPRASQSSIIIPVPGDETIYYIFTTQDLNGTDSLQLKYSMFDLKMNNGKGAIVKSNVLMYMKNTERLTASGNWLIVHEIGNSTFRSYPISAEGIGNPEYTDIGTIHSAAIPHNLDGYMKLGPRNLIAAPITTPGVSAKIEVFQLNDTTGALKNYQSIDLNDTDPTASIYGIEFSPAGNKLFATVRYGNGASSALYEYSIDSLYRIRLRQKLPIASDLGAIQIGPNGTIYVAVNNAANNTFLGTIAANEDTLATSSFLQNGFQLASGTNSWLGLPNFIQENSNQLGGPEITVKGLCNNDSTRFTGTPRDQIDEYSWSVFLNGALVASSTKAQWAALLNTPGDYTVNMRLHNRCDSDVTLSKNFTITGPPADPSKGVPLCNTPTVTLDANPGNVPGLSYQWTTGETTETLVVSEQGLYVVEITDAVGCKREGQFIAADSRPIFDLGPDETICEEENVTALNVRNPGMTYAWTINGAPASSTAVQNVDTTTPGVFDYTVTVTDPVTSCFRTEDKIYTINVSPLFTLTSTPISSCGNTDGTVSINLQTSTPAGGPLYSYFLQGPSGNDDDIDQTAPNTFTLTNLGAGTYSAIVRDQISECTVSQTIGLSDATYTANATAAPPNCDPVILNVTTAGASLPLQWTATNSGTLAVTTGTAGTAVFPTTPLEEGTYTIEITDNLGCVQTFNQTITPNPENVITLAPDLCAMTLTASGGATYAWTVDGVTVPGVDGPVLNLTPKATTQLYSVVGSGGAGCPGTETLTLDVQNVPTPTLSQTTGCADIARMTVDPNGNFNYRWFVNGAFDVTYGGSTIVLNTGDNGKVFTVQIFEPQSGCTRDSGPLTAEVVGEVTAQLSSTPPCDDDQPITLTATTTNPTGATYAWKRNDGIITGVTTPTTDQTEEGNYEVEVSKGSCKATSSLTITRAPLPEGDLPNIAIICDDPENTDTATRQVDLDPGNFAGYDWMKNGVTIGYTQQVLTADSKGLYEVTITNASGCKSIDKTEVVNECIPRINAPNAFRPGSTVFNPDRKDLTNGDFWIISRFIEDDQFKVFIFNRWGEMVFSSTDRFFKWNGGYNNDIGRPLPPGTYSYVVQYVSAFRPNEGVKEKRGGVALIR